MSRAMGGGKLDVLFEIIDVARPRLELGLVRIDADDDVLILGRGDLDYAPMAGVQRAERMNRTDLAALAMKLAQREPGLTQRSEVLGLSRHS